MNRSSRPEKLDLQQQLSSTTTTRSRSRSSSSSIEHALSSNTSNESAYSIIHPLTSVHPEAAYIAPSAAARLVTSDHESFFQDLQDEGIIGPNVPTIHLTPTSLKLVNQFLDFLLYSFFSSAKSTSLSSLRLAVAEVLRARLAKEAVAGADQELDSYLGGEEEEQIDSEAKDEQVGPEWDLESTWKKARLQCMVYSSLGDLEEDDEVFYSEYSRLEGAVGPDQYEKQSTIPGVISPAVAIWLTSILEFIGEQTLLIAGHATIARYSAQRIAAAATSQENSSDATFPDKPMVEELDTEKVALNPSLGRMWRQWRKKVRGGRGSFSIPPREGGLQRLERQSSITSRVTDSEITAPREEKQTDSERSTPAASPEGDDTNESHGQAAEKVKDAPLTPIVESASPVEERKPASEGEGTIVSNREPAEKPEKRRPQSLIILPWTAKSPFVRSTESPPLRRHSSLPHLKRGDFADPVTEAGAVEQTVEEDHDVTPKEPTEIVDEVTEAKAEQVFYTPAEEKPEAFEESEGLVGENVQPAPTLRSTSSVQTLVQATGEKEPSVAGETADGLERAHSFKDDGKEELEDKETASSPTPTGPIGERATIAEDNVALSSGESTSSKDVEQVDEHSEVEPSHEQLEPPTSVTPAASEEHGPVSVGTATLDDEGDLSLPVDNTIEHVVHQSKPSKKETFDAAALPSDDDSYSSAAQRDSKVDVSGKPSSIKSSHSKHASSSSGKHYSERKLGQLTLVQSPSKPPSIVSDRGTSVRVFTPPTTPDRSRRSSSFSKGQRPIHTSGSSSSQASGKLKNLIQWPNENSKYAKVQESDSESRSSLHSDRFANMDEKERSFEELISSGGTIHCTITPDPIRNMEVRDKPVKTKTPTSDLADFFRSTGPDGAIPRNAPGSPNTSKPLPTSPRSHRSGSLARDPRVEETSTSSLSHFLMTTAPPEAPPASPRSVGPQGLKAARLPASSSGISLPSSSKAISVGPTPPSPTTIAGLPAVLRQTRSDSVATSIRTKNRLLAREASGSSGSDTTSALADFFRNTTPPVDGEPVGTHRISRSVAPFRNTMDSEQFEDGDLPDEGDSHNERSFVTTSAPHESYQSSYTSSTALIRSNSRKARDHGGTVSSLPSEPKRKQTRIKDPYAIDIDELDDDEDMEGLMDLVIPKKRDEESLIDFLRSAPPPPPPEPEDEKKPLQKKSSSVSLMGRLRSSSRKNSIASNADKMPAWPPVPKYVPLITDDAASRSSEVGHHKRPSYSSARADFDSQRGGNSMSPPSMGARVQPRTNIQARGARSERNDTDSLADFLKHTGPPENLAAPTPPPKDEGGLAMLKKISFSRNKKVRA